MIAILFASFCMVSLTAIISFVKENPAQKNIESADDSWQNLNSVKLDDSGVPYDFDSIYSYTNFEILDLAGLKSFAALINHGTKTSDGVKTDFAGKNVRLSNNINCTTSSGGAFEGTISNTFTPSIGGRYHGKWDMDGASSENRYFKGNFDGQNHTIYNFNLNPVKNEDINFTNGMYRNEADTFGFFSCIGSNSTIQNLKLSNYTFSISAETSSDGQSIGGIVGYLNGGTITNCVVKDFSVSATYEVDAMGTDKGMCLAGIFGVGYGTVSNCYVEAVSINNYCYLAGIGPADSPYEYNSTGLVSGSVSCYFGTSSSSISQCVVRNINGTNCLSGDQGNYEYAFPYYYAYEHLLVEEREYDHSITNCQNAAGNNLDSACSSEGGSDGTVWYYGGPDYNSNYPYLRQFISGWVGINFDSKTDPNNGRTTGSFDDNYILVPDLGHTNIGSFRLNILDVQIEGGECTYPYKQKIKSYQTEVEVEDDSGFGWGNNTTTQIVTTQHKINYPTCTGFGVELGKTSNITNRYVSDSILQNYDNFGNTFANYVQAKNNNSDYYEYEDQLIRDLSNLGFLGQYWYSSLIGLSDSSIDKYYEGSMASNTDLVATNLSKIFAYYENLYYQDADEPSLLCSEKHSANIGPVVLEYCDCNLFATLLNNNGDVTKLSQHSDANMSSANLTAFDNVVSLFNNCITTVFPISESRFNTLSSSIVSLFQLGNNSGVSIDYEDGRFFGINTDNKKYPSGFNNETGINVLSKLLGFSSSSTFVANVNKVATEFLANPATDNRLNYDGAVYTANYGYILPYKFAIDGIGSLYACVYVDLNGNVYAWLNDYYLAYDIAMGSYGNKNVEVFGRCELFESVILEEDDGSGFLNYVREFANSFKQNQVSAASNNKLKYDGAILTSNGCVIYPFRVSNSGEEYYGDNVYVLFILDPEFNPYFYVSDTETMNSITDTAQNTSYYIYGRCDLVESINYIGTAEELVYDTTDIQVRSHLQNVNFTIDPGYDLIGYRKVPTITMIDEDSAYVNKWTVYAETEIKKYDITFNNVFGVLNGEASIVPKVLINEEQTITRTFTVNHYENISVTPNTVNTDGEFELKYSFTDSYGRDCIVSYTIPEKYTLTKNSNPGQITGPYTITPEVEERKHKVEFKNASGHTLNVDSNPWDVLYLDDISWEFIFDKELNFVHNTKTATYKAATGYAIDSIIVTKTTNIGGVTQSSTNSYNSLSEDIPELTDIDGDLVINIAYAKLIKLTFESVENARLYSPNDLINSVEKVEAYIGAGKSISVKYFDYPTRELVYSCGSIKMAVYKLNPYYRQVKTFINETTEFTNESPEILSDSTFKPLIDYFGCVVTMDFSAVEGIVNMNVTGDNYENINDGIFIIEFGTPVKVVITQIDSYFTYTYQFIDSLTNGIITVEYEMQDNDYAMASKIENENRVWFTDLLSRDETNVANYDNVQFTAPDLKTYPDLRITYKNIVPTFELKFYGGNLA